MLHLAVNCLTAFDMLKTRQIRFEHVRHRCGWPDWGTALPEIRISTVLCTRYTPAEWHGRLGGGVQADAMVDRLIHGAVRIDLGDVNVRKLLSARR